ncbi:MAG: hypothetical protein AAF193_08205, partial [Bacteroidota bacterium]
GQRHLIQNIARWKSTQEEDPKGWSILFEDGTVAPRAYYEAWLLVQYSLDVKKMSYRELLRSKTSETAVRKEMELWYQNKLENMDKG